MGVPNRQYRRATQVLGPESADPIDYDVVKQDDGFYLFSFPDVDEYDFRDIVMLLKSNGVTTIGVDEILTEKKIMKLTDLLKEQGSPDENNIIDQLEVALERWLEDKTPPYDRLDSCERSDQYHEDIKDIVDSFKNPLPSPGEEDKIEKDDEELANFQGDLGTMQEQKLRRLIKRKIETMKLKDLLPLKEQNIDSKNPGADPFQKLYDKQNPNDPKAIPGKHFPNTIKKVINLKMDSDVGEPVTVEFTPGSNLENVKISWGNESHTIDFEKEDFEDNYEHDMIAEFMAESDDMKWQFILDVVLPNNYEDSGTIDDILWDDLIVQHHPENEDHLDPEDRSDYDDDPRMDPEIRSDFDDPVMEEGMMCEMCGEVHEGSCSLQEALTKRQLQIRAGIIK